MKVISVQGVVGACVVKLETPQVAKQFKGRSPAGGKAGNHVGLSKEVVRRERNWPDGQKSPKVLLLQITRPKDHGSRELRDSLLEKGIKTMGH